MLGGIINMKKQIAVLMAAATAVGAVAPVVANAEVKSAKEVAVNEVTTKIREALNTRYADKKQDGVRNANANEVDDYLNSRYAVFVKVDGGVNDLERNGLKNFNDTDYKDFANQFALGNGVNVADTYVVTDASKVTGALESAALAKKDVKVFVVDKGIKDNRSVYDAKNKIYVTENPGTNEVLLSQLATDIRNKPYLKDGAKEPEIKDGELKIELKSGETITVKAGDEVLDLKKAYAKDGQELDLDATNNNQDSVFEQVAKFGVVANEDDKTITRDVASGDTEVYDIKDSYKSVIEVPTIYTSENGYTQKGADLVNALIDAKQGKNGNKFNYEGKNYILRELQTATAKIEKDGDNYVLKLVAKVVDDNDKLVTRDIQFNIKGKVQKDLVRVLNDLKGTANVVVGHFTKLAGADRFATAIEVSNERFEKGEADSVVIVGANALMDGLSAVPLAKAKKAPVLLADAKNGLSNATINEIDRATKNLNRKTVYIVGGTNSVPTSVDKVLAEKFGAVVVRVSGVDRYETSLEVARRLSYDENLVANPKAYVVGGEGAADAMSVSAVAAKNDANNKVSPVLVVPQAGITRNTRDFIARLHVDDAYVIGGENSVSTQVLRDLALAAGRVERIAGADRYETNVNVIKKFYAAKNEVDKIDAKSVVVTSGDTKYLVDSQTAGAFAAEKDAPILLTGSTLTTSQKDLFKADKQLDKAKVKSAYQVGGVVSADVMKVVVDKLGL